MSRNFRFSQPQILTSEASRYMKLSAGPRSISRLSRGGLFSHHVDRIMREEHAAVRKAYDTEGGSEHSMTAAYQTHHGEKVNLMSKYRAKHSDQLQPVSSEGPMRDSLVQYVRHSVRDAKEMITHETSRENRNLLIASLSSLLIIQTLFLMAETIIPVYVDKKHPTLSTIEVSIIMVFPEIAGFLLSPIIGAVLERFGRKNVIMSGSIMVAAAQALLALTDFIADDTLYFVAACFCRFLSGAGDQQVQTTVYSVIASTFMSKREKYLGFAGSAVGVGQLLGPILGGLLNSLFGYLPNYFFFSALLFIQAIANYFLLPPSLNNKPEVTQEEFSKKIVNVEKETNVKFSWFLKNRRCLFALISCTMMSYFSQFIQAFVTVMFVDLMHIEEEWHGWIVAIPASCQIVGATLTGYLVNRAPKRVFILIAFIGLSMSDFLMGPSNLLFFPKWKLLFFIGFGINGFSEGMIFTPIIPEIIDSVYIAKGIVEGESDDVDAVIGDKASGLYGSFYSLGTITSPLLGGVVYSLMKNNWYNTCDFFACIAVGWTLIYLFVNVLPDIRKDKKQQEELDEKIFSSPIVQEKFGLTSGSLKGHTQKHILEPGYESQTLLIEDQKMGADNFGLQSQADGNTTDRQTNA